MARRYGEEPVVLDIYCRSDASMEHASHRVFVGASLEWAEYILVHRIANPAEGDPCQLMGAAHSDVVVGPMADNDTGEIVRLYVEAGIYDAEWFREQIMRGRDGMELQGVALGNQVVFCNPDFAREVLELESVWQVDSAGEWVKRG